MTLFWIISIIIALAIIASSAIYACMVDWSQQSWRDEQTDAQLAAAVRVYDQLERESEWRSR